MSIKGKVNFMLLKNKIYSGIIIVIFIVCLIIGLNENIIGNPLGKNILFINFFIFCIINNWYNKKKKALMPSFLYSTMGS